MTSAFSALTAVNGRPAGSVSKVSFSAQEWCGHVYAQLLAADRFAYWQMDGPGFEKELARLGRSPRTARMP